MSLLMHGRHGLQLGKSWAMQHACKSWRALSTDPPKGQPTSVTGNHADPNNISSEAGHGQQMVRGSPNQQGQPKTSQADASTDAHSKHEARATSSTTSAPESSQGAKGAMKLSGITEWGVHKLHAKITAALERVQALREHAAAVAAAAAQNQKAAANSIQQASQLGSKDPMGVAAGASEHTGISRPPPSSASASAALSAGHASTSLSQPVSAATAPVASSIPENVMRRVRAGSDMLNELTGYSAVESLKAAVGEADALLITARANAAAKKQVYEALLISQMRVQRDLNSLLMQPKANWTEGDVQRFTELYRGEHKMDAEVAAAREAAESAADEVEAQQAALMHAIRERYNGEQAWGDKIRRSSTWYTWGLMGLQLASFVGLLVVIEPRRVSLLQARVEEALEGSEARTREQMRLELSATMEGVRAMLEEHETRVVIPNLLEGGLLEAGQGLNVVGAGGRGGGGQGSMSPHMEVTHVGPQPQQADIPKFMDAIVQYMDGVHVELVHNRQEMQRLAAAVSELTAAAAGSSVGGDGGEGDVADGAGAAALVGQGSAAGAVHEHEASSNRYGGPRAEKGDITEGTARDVHAAAEALHGQGGRWVGRWMGGLSREQAVGVAAAASAAAGAAVGVLLAVYFRGSG